MGPPPFLGLLGESASWVFSFSLPKIVASLFGEQVPFSLWLPLDCKTNASAIFYGWDLCTFVGGLSYAIDK